MSEERKALIAGSTGLVGGFVLRRLAQEPAYGEVVALVRRQNSVEPSAKVQERVVDFDRLEQDSEIFGADDVFCCLGTTIKKAGSQAAFRKVDLGYVASLAGLARERGARRFVLISSIGADSSSKNFYLRVKGEAEEAVAACGYPEVHVLRPSLLLGDRQESRPGERAAIVASTLVAPFIVGPMRHYRPVAAETVAAAMIGAALHGEPGRHVYTYRRIAELAGR